jgi:hypothetical protein
VRPATSAPAKFEIRPVGGNGKRATPSALLAAEGIRYVCDWGNDEQPHRMTPKTGELHSLGVNAYLDDNYIHLHGRRTINEVNLLWRECRLTTAFASAFVVNAGRFHASRKRYVFHAGMGHLPTEVAPDLHSRSYLIEADVHMPVCAIRFPSARHEHRRGACDRGGAGVATWLDFQFTGFLGGIGKNLASSGARSSSARAARPTAAAGRAAGAQ